MNHTQETTSSLAQQGWVEALAFRPVNKNIPIEQGFSPGPSLLQLEIIERTSQNRAAGRPPPSKFKRK
jgi:hypothetical protein